MYIYHAVWRDGHSYYKSFITYRILEQIYLLYMRKSTLPVFISRADHYRSTTYVLKYKKTLMLLILKT